MSAEHVHRNYNRLGLVIMERIYSDDYLSIGGPESTERLAELAGIDETSRVLDVGSGIGGPALHLAGERGCRVTGIDLLQHTIEEAAERTAARGLDHRVDFCRADATTLPLADDSIDVVWGQDAWCHVPDKEALIGECARILVPGGRIAFTDWLVTGPMEPVDREEILTAAASVDMATADDYRRLLGANGFVGLVEEDLSALFARQYDEIYHGLETDRDDLVATFGADVYDTVRTVNGLVLRGFASGGIGGGRFVARKP